MCHTLQAFNKFIEQGAFLVPKNNVICQLHHTPQNMYQAVPTFHIASSEKLGEGREQGQQSHIIYFTMETCMLVEGEDSLPTMCPMNTL